MDLKELKRITAFARKAGIKSLKFADVSLEFNDQVAPPTRKRLKIVPESDDSKPAPPAEPTLEQINQYIYGQTDEVG